MLFFISEIADFYLHNYNEVELCLYLSALNTKLGYTLVGFTPLDH